MRYFRDKRFTLCIKKKQFQNITKQDLDVLPAAENVPVELIYDGNILYENFSKHTYDENWLIDELKRRSLTVSEIAYAVIGTKGNLFIDLFQDN